MSEDGKRVKKYRNTKHGKIPIHARASKQEIKVRLWAIVHMIIEGKGRKEIFKEIKSKFNVSTGTVNRYFLQADKLLEQTSKLMSPEKELALAYNRYNLLYSKLYKLGKYRDAALVIDKMVELLGLKKIKLEVEQSLIFKSQIGDDGIIRSGFVEDKAQKKIKEKGVFDYLEGEVLEVETKEEESSDELEGI